MKWEKQVLKFINIEANNKAMLERSKIQSQEKIKREEMSIKEKELKLKEEDRKSREKIEKLKAETALKVAKQNKNKYDSKKK